MHTYLAGSWMHRSLSPSGATRPPVSAIYLHSRQRRNTSRSWQTWIFPSDLHPMTIGFRTYQCFQPEVACYGENHEEH